MATSSRSLSSGRRRTSGAVNFVFKTYAIAANTFVESIRQPVFAIIVGGAVTIILLSPYLTMFTLLESYKMMIDMGLATMMLAGLLLAAFTASNVISGEIENKTALTVVAKPVGRAEFILGKFAGVMLGLMVASYLLSLTLVLTVTIGGMEEQIERQFNLWIMLSVVAAMVVAVGYGIYSNFFNDRPFPSRTIGAAIPLFTLCGIVWFLINPRNIANEYLIKGTPFMQALFSSGSSVHLQTIYACMVLTWSILIMAAVAVAVSTRLTVVVNVVLCSMLFLFGLLSEFLFRSWAQGKEARKVLADGGGLVWGTFIVVAFILLGLAVGLVAVRYLSRRLNMMAAAIFVGVGIIATLVMAGAMEEIHISMTQLMGLATVPAQSVFNFSGRLLLSGGLLSIICILTALSAAAILVTYYIKSKYLQPLLKFTSYLGLCLGGAVTTSLLLKLPDHLDVSGAKVVAAKVSYAVLPNLQVLWVADIIAAEEKVNFAYVLECGAYSMSYIAAFFILAVMLFRERQLA